MVNISLGAEGNVEQLNTFLRNLERSARMIDVENFRYATISEEENTLDVTFSLVSPYIKIESMAVTDDPVELDLSDPTFIKTINELKDMKHYNITIEQVNQELLENSEESTPSEPAADEATGVETSDEVGEEATGEPATQPQNLP